MRWLCDEFLDKYLVITIIYSNYSPRGPLVRSQWPIVTESDIFCCPLTLQVVIDTMLHDICYKHRISE